MQRQTVTSELIPPRDRLPFLIEEFGREMQHVDWRPAEHIDPLRLNASCTFSAVGDVRLADVHWSSGRVSATRNSYDGSYADHLIVYRERQRAGWYELADGTVYETEPGTIMLYPAEHSFRAGGVPAEHDFNFQIAMLPRSAFSTVGRWSDTPQVLHLPPGEAFNDLVSSYVADWARLLPDLDPTGAGAATATLVNLLSVAEGVVDARSPEALRSVSAARVRAARRFVAENLTQTSLSPDAIARHLRISLRQLHLDFEPTGTTVARFILAARVDMAKCMLATRPHLSIIEVAYACGFDAVSTFYRVFKAQTGATATEYRRQALGF